MSAARDALHALVEQLPEASIAAAADYQRELLAQHGRAGAAPQWGEAYQLFDGAYLSLDDLLGSADD
jgi:hypothetical protein